MESWEKVRKIRLKESLDQSGTIEILCNNPFIDDWKIIPLKCSEPCKPGVLLKEVLSWIQQDFGTTMNEQALAYWHIWDENGRVNLSMLREPIDPERFVILLHLPESDSDMEEEIDPRDSRDPTYRFTRHTRWRRLKSRYKVDIVEPVILPPEPDPPSPKPLDKEVQEKLKCRTVEQRIQEKHQVYHQRFRKWKRFINAEEVSSPFAFPIETGEEEEEDYRDYSGPLSSDEEDDDFTAYEKTEVEGRVSRDFGGNEDHPVDATQKLEEQKMERPGRTQNLMPPNDRRDQDASAGGNGRTLRSRGNWNRDAPVSGPVIGISDHVGPELGRRCISIESRNPAIAEIKDDLTLQYGLTAPNEEKE
jgi:hypothetical protein